MLELLGVRNPKSRLRRDRFCVPCHYVGVDVTISFLLPNLAPLSLSLSLFSKKKGLMLKHRATVARAAQPKSMTRLDLPLASFVINQHFRALRYTS